MKPVITDRFKTMDRYHVTEWVSYRYPCKKTLIKKLKNSFASTSIKPYYNGKTCILTKVECIIDELAGQYDKQDILDTILEIVDGNPIILYKLDYMGLALTSTIDSDAYLCVVLN